MQGRKHDKGWDSFSGNLLALRQDSYCCTSAASVWPLNHSSFARHCIICQPEPWVSQLDSARVIFPPEYANIVIELHKCLPTDLFKNTFLKNRSTWFKTFSKLVENLRQVTEKQKRTEALPESTETKRVCAIRSTQWRQGQIARTLLGKSTVPDTKSGLRYTYQYFERTK
jgi:hypothetical protein